MWWLNQQTCNEEHLAQTTADRIDEAILLAAVPVGQRHVMTDGSHRATIRLRSDRAVEGLLITQVESVPAIEVVPLAMQRVATELRRRRLL